jgi:short-subunit dehydrogenase
MSKGTALITGASAGIGLELSKRFAADRYDLVLLARREDKLIQIKKELEDAWGIQVHPIVKDLSASQSAEQVFTMVQKQGLHVDYLINNAGFGHLGKFAETDLEVFRRMMQLNMVSLTELTHLFLPVMLERKRGGIMNVASTAGFMPGPLMAVYYASKAYVLSFSQALSNELKGSGITVHTLCPGATETEFAGTAEMDNSKLFSSPFISVMDAATVARLGYEDMMKGKSLTITGGMNKFIVQSLRVSPRNMVMNLTRWIMDQR